MGYLLVPGIYLNPRMQPSCLALIARFVTVGQSLSRSLTVPNTTGMRQTTVVCGLGVSTEIL